MSKYSLVGELPRHVDCHIAAKFLYDDKMVTSAQPAIWFGLVSFPGRAWGCTVMLESGAIYRNLPPHALMFCREGRPVEPSWSIDEAQLWDCYGEEFTTLEYDLLREHRCMVRIGGDDLPGEYLFTAAPIGDAWTARPEQMKEFIFIRLGNGRLTIQPTNRVIFEERAFTRNKNLEFPKDLRRQTEVWSCE